MMKMMKVMKVMKMIRTNIAVPVGIVSKVVAV
jgi:hypothetical protein